MHCTDQPGEWVVRLAAGGPEVERAHEKADTAVRGAASDLFLLLHNRIGPERVELFGEPDLLDRFRTAATL